VFGEAPIGDVERFPLAKPAMVGRPKERKLLNLESIGRLFADGGSL